MSTTEYTVTTATAYAIEAAINQAAQYARDNAVTMTVNGRTVAFRHMRGRVAVGYQNGSVAVAVQGRTRGTVGTVWAKAGDKLTIQIGAAA